MIEKFMKDNDDGGYDHDDDHDDDVHDHDDVRIEK